MWVLASMFPIWRAGDLHELGTLFRSRLALALELFPGLKLSSAY